MEKTMYEISVESGDGTVCIKGPDAEGGEASVMFAAEQAELVIKWIREAVEEAFLGNGEAHEK